MTLQTKPRISYPWWAIQIVKLSAYLGLLDFSAELLKRFGKIEQVVVPWCCELGCTNKATWVIEWGNSPDDYTHSCSEHIANMMMAGKTNTVYQMEA